MFWCNVHRTSHCFTSLTFILKWMREDRRKRWNVFGYKCPTKCLEPCLLFTVGVECLRANEFEMVVLYAYKCKRTQAQLKLTIPTVCSAREIAEGFRIYQDHIISVFTFICIYVFSSSSSSLGFFLGLISFARLSTFVNVKYWHFFNRELQCAAWCCVWLWMCAPYLCLYMFNSNIQISFETLRNITCVYWYASASYLFWIWYFSVLISIFMCSCEIEWMNEWMAEWKNEWKGAIQLKEWYKQEERAKSVFCFDKNNLCVRFICHWYATTLPFWNRFYVTFSQCSFLFARFFVAFAFSLAAMALGFPILFKRYVFVSVFEFTLLLYFSVVLALHSCASLFSMCDEKY